VNALDISRLEHFASLQWGRWIYVCVLLYGVLRNEYVAMIKIVGINEKLICFISFKTILDYLNPPNCVSKAKFKNIVFQYV
jgi:hypothetical protein